MWASAYATMPSGCIGRNASAASAPDKPAMSTVLPSLRSSLSISLSSSSFESTTHTMSHIGEAASERTKGEEDPAPYTIASTGRRGSVTTDAVVSLPGVSIRRSSVPRPSPPIVLRFVPRPTKTAHRPR